MEQSQIEIVKHPKVKHVKMFVNKIKSVGNHMHNDFEIFLTLGGKGVVRINAQTYRFASGDIFFINSGDVHSLSSASNNSLPAGMAVDEPVSLFIQISNNFLCDYFPELHSSVFKSSNLRDILPKDDYQRVSSLLAEAAIAYFSEHSHFQLDVVSNLSKVFGYVYRYVNYEVVSEAQKERMNRKNNRIERIISYIDENFDSQVRLKDIADEEKLSMTYLSHLFASSFGTTFQEFVNNKRLEQSVRSMANKGETLLEISCESGFSDLKYMNKMFIKHFGCTPKEYRSQHSLAYEDSPQDTGKSEIIYDDKASLESMSLFYQENLR
jgi:AraC-like DNA-binding protein